METLKRNPLAFLVTGVVVLVVALALLIGGNNGAEGGESNLDQLGVNYIEYRSDVSTSSNPRIWRGSFQGFIGAGEQFETFLNPVLGTIYVTEGWYIPIGDSNGSLTASSTFYFDIGTSSVQVLTEVQTVAGGAWGEYSSSTPGNLPFGSIMDSMRISTSTATSTSSSLLRANLERNGDDIDIATTSREYFDTHAWPVRIEIGEYLIGLLTEDGHGAAGSNVVCEPTFDPDDGFDTNICESATSTSRGFDIIWGFDFFTTSTPNDAR